MKGPPCIWSLALFLILATVLSGCASTTQSMPPPTGGLTLNLGGPVGPIAPEAQAYRQGPVVVVVGCQIGITAKPVGLDVLNPAVAATASDNNVPIGGSSGSLTDDSVGAKVADALRQYEASKSPPEPPAKQAGDTVGDGSKPTSAAPAATPALEEQTAAPGGGG